MVAVALLGYGGIGVGQLYAPAAVSAWIDQQQLRFVCSQYSRASAQPWFAAYAMALQLHSAGDWRICACGGFAYGRDGAAWMAYSHLVGD